jgi:hypothetical protein
MSNELKKMTLSSVCIKKITDDTMLQIEEYIKKINPNHDKIEINDDKDDLSFYFENYELLTKYLGFISHLINGGIDYDPKYIQKWTENEYTLIVWS